MPEDGPPPSLGLRGREACLCGRGEGALEEDQGGGEGGEEEIGNRITNDLGGGLKGRLFFGGAPGGCARQRAHPLLNCDIFLISAVRFIRNRHGNTSLG